MYYPALTPVNREAYLVVDEILGRNVTHSDWSIVFKGLTEGCLRCKVFISLWSLIIRGDWRGRPTPPRSAVGENLRSGAIGSALMCDLTRASVRGVSVISSFSG